MPRTAAKPFDFDEFGADARAPEPVFTAADLEAARCDAHVAALQTLIAEQARAQTILLDKISTQLTAAQSEFDSALAERRKTLSATARDIVTTFCAGAAAEFQIDISLDLLDKYLAATPEQSPVTLFLPADAANEIVTALTKAFASRKITEFASVATSGEIASGDCRIEWRGGAIMRDMNVITEDINTIFASVDSDIVAAHGQKTRNS